MNDLALNFVSFLQTQWYFLQMFLSSYCFIFHLVGLLLILYGFRFWFYEFCFLCVFCVFFPLAYLIIIIIIFFSSVSFPKREKGN